MAGVDFKQLLSVNGSFVVTENTKKYSVLTTRTGTVTFTNDAAENSMLGGIIPANQPTAGSVYVLLAWGRYFNNTGSNQTLVHRMKFGSSTMNQGPALSFTSSASQRAWLVRCTMVMEAVGATGAQRTIAELWGTATGADGGGWASMGTSESMIGYGSAAEATDSGKNFQLTIQHGAAVSGLSIDCRGGLIERNAI